MDAGVAAKNHRWRSITPRNSLSLFLAFYIFSLISSKSGKKNVTLQPIARTHIGAPVVQWIELRFPKPPIRVRFPAGVRR